MAHPSQTRALAIVGNMAVTHAILQFKLEKIDSPNHVIDKIEKLLMRYGLQNNVTETLRSSAKPILMLIVDGGR